jgi:glycosyltransferase involved in cell wall biosynthesis
MINGQRLVVVMPAYRAARTLEATFQALPHDIIDKTLLVDDASHDDTVTVARRLGVEVHVHPENRGYGGNQKTCYAEALAAGADIVVMVHPDYQYEPRLVTAMAGMVASGVYDAVLGSRILGGGALAGGMPRWKYVANRLLTLFQNLLLGARLSEYHTGYRAYSRALLEQTRWAENSDDFVFDNQILAQCILGGFRIGEISVPTKYFDGASSINFARSVTYGLGVVRVSVMGLMHRLGVRRNPRLRRRGTAADR